MFPLLIGPIADLLKTTINKIWGDKISEAEKLQLQNEMAKAMMEYDWKSIEKEYADRDSARSLAAADVAKGNWFTNVLAATVRPFFGYVVMGAFIISFVGPLAGYPQLQFNDIQKEVMISVIYFFFGGRTVEKAVSIWKGGK